MHVEPHLPLQISEDSRNPVCSFSLSLQPLLCLPGDIKVNLREPSQHRADLGALPGPL